MRKPHEWWNERVAAYLAGRKRGTPSPGDDEFLAQLSLLIDDKLHYARCRTPLDTRQDVVLKLLEGHGLHRFDPTVGRFESYIGAIARNVMFDKRRSVARKGSEIESDPDLDAIAEFLEAPRHDSGLPRQLRSAIATLWGKERYAVDSWAAGHKQREIAKDLGMTTGGVSKLLWIAFRKLRAILDEERNPPPAP